MREDYFLYVPGYSDTHFAWASPERLSSSGRQLFIKDPTPGRYSRASSWCIPVGAEIFRQTTHPDVLICTREVALRDFADCVAEYQQRLTSGVEAEWLAARAAAKDHNIHESPEIRAASDTADRLCVARNCKTWTLLKVGVERWYWTARYPGRRRYFDDLDAHIIAKGFARLRELAMADAEAATRAVPGFVEPLRYPDGSGDQDIRDRYKRLHKRAPKLSDAVDARPEGPLGYLYERNYYTDYGGGDWKAYPITKKTKKRIFVKAERYSRQAQNSFDREALERDGCTYYRDDGLSAVYMSGFFTEAGKERYETERAARDAHWAKQRAAGLYPMLSLKIGFTRADVLSAFRRLAHDLSTRAAIRSSSAS